MGSFIEYLKRPELVVSVQEWFGVEYLNDDNIDDDLICDNSHGENESIKSRKTNDKSEVTHTNELTDRNGFHHRRTISNQSSDSSNDFTSKGSETNAQRYRINNRFWYYLFVIGTELGDEIFYATMIPFWFWNIDGAVGRRVVFVWSTVMYVGQGLKDVIRWPRPGPPVQRLQSKWSIEYGMPSTHAMVWKQIRRYIWSLAYCTVNLLVGGCRNAIFGCYLHVRSVSCEHE